MFTALLSAIALFITLFIQTMQSPLAGSWLLFLFAACCYSYKIEKKRDYLWWASLAWLLTIAISTFIICPVNNGAATMWILAAMPMLGLSINEKDLPKVLDGCLAVIILYAFGLITQVVMDVHYTMYDYYIKDLHFRAASWPLLDPNNAAAVINAGLIPSFYMAFRRPKWWGLVGILGVSLLLTVSKAGIIAFSVAAFIITFELLGWFFVYPIVILVLLFAPHFYPFLLHSFNQRMEIWTNSAPLLTRNKLSGLGLGMFSYYYNMVKGPNDMGVYYAHNDILQFAIEMGFPAVLVFYLLGVVVFAKTTAKNLVSGCVLLAIFIQSLVEFAFYVPAISIVSGIALAYHRKKDV